LKKRALVYSLIFIKFNEVLKNEYFSTLNRKKGGIEMKIMGIGFNKKIKLILLMTCLFCILLPPVQTLAKTWIDEFDLSKRTLSATGKATYFILEPGFQIILESKRTRMTITVLNETKIIGGITTRVVEEREEKRDELIEISRNFLAIDQDTGDIFYFGEEVDDYKKGKVVKHSGAWVAYEGDARPGLLIPGKPEVGMRYYQEIAPKVAMDRAEVLSISKTYKTSAGEFENCLKTKETSKISFGREYKYYAPGIGIIKDGRMKLVRYGFVEI
jgi:hypothetical protein